MAETASKSRLKKDDLRTFTRLLGFARPYASRLAIGAVCSLVGGGSLVAMFFSGQHILGFVLRNQSFGAPSAIEAGATGGEAGATGGAQPGLTAAGAVAPPRP